MKQEEKNIRFEPKGIVFSLIVVFIIWLVYWYEIKFGKNFNSYGIYPGTLKGLRGVLFSPFLHSGTSHLFNNSIPFIVLTSILFTFYKNVSKKILLYGTLLTGLLTWSIARESYHIGLSGVIYMLFSFIFFSGILKRHYRLIAASLVIIFLYGSMIWYILPIKQGISWEGHLSGFLTGILFALIFRRKGLTKERLEFQETEFDTLFDSEGNFIGQTKDSSDE